MLAQTLILVKGEQGNRTRFAFNHCAANHCTVLLVNKVIYISSFSHEVDDRQRFTFYKSPFNIVFRLAG